MATTAEITEQLAKKQADYDNLTRLISEVTRAAADWKADAENDKIRSGKKGKIDEADRQKKLQTAASYLDQAASFKAQQAQLVADMNSLRKTLEAKDEQGKILAQQGVSASAEDIKATGQAEAAKTQATITAQAQAKAIETNAQTEAAKQKRNQYITYAILAALFLGLVLFLVSRMKKRKK